VDLHIDSSLVASRPEPQIESSIYFCCREALRRLAGHESVALNVQKGNGGIEFEISSDGRADLLPQGLVMDMRDRVEALGGGLVVRDSDDSAADGRKGFLLRGTVPA
jgi:hypothetical protein